MAGGECTVTGRGQGRFNVAHSLVHAAVVRTDPSAVT